MHLCWILSIASFATIELVAPLTFLAAFGREKSPAEIFALLGRSLPYVTVLTVLAIAAVGLAGADEVIECVELALVVLVGFVPICFYRVHFENYDFVEQFVEENKERMRCLLFNGMGVDVNTFETISNSVEIVLVEFWRMKLTKRWTEFNQKELGELMFDSGIETAKLIVEKLGNDARSTIFGFMQAWLTQVEHIRVPLRAAKELRGSSVERQVVNCIAIVLANDTREVREARSRQSGKVNLPYIPTARMAARKAAMEGFLHWPRCLRGNADARIISIDFDTTNLYLVSEGEKRLCAKEDIPKSVVSTLKEMVEAGFLNLAQDGKASVSIFFRNEKMVLGTEDWNASRFVEHSSLQGEAISGVVFWLALASQKES